MYKIFKFHVHTIGDKTQWCPIAGIKQEIYLNIEFEKGIYWIATTAPSSGDFFLLSFLSLLFLVHNDLCILDKIMKF